MKFAPRSAPLFFLIALSFAFVGCASNSSNDADTQAFLQSKALPEKIPAFMFNERSKTGNPAELSVHNNAGKHVYLVAAQGEKLYRVKVPKSQLSTLSRSLQRINQANATKPESGGRRQNFTTIYDTDGTPVDVALYTVPIDGSHRVVLIVSDFAKQAEEIEVQLTPEATDQLIALLKTLGTGDEETFIIELKRP